MRLTKSAHTLWAHSSKYAVGDIYVYIYIFYRKTLEHCKNQLQLYEQHQTKHRRPQQIYTNT